MAIYPYLENGSETKRDHAQLQMGTLSGQFPPRNSAWGFPLLASQKSTEFTNDICLFWMVMKCYIWYYMPMYVTFLAKGAVQMKLWYFVTLRKWTSSSRHLGSALGFRFFEWSFGWNHGAKNCTSSIMYRYSSENYPRNSSGNQMWQWRIWRTAHLDSFR